MGNCLCLNQSMLKIMKDENLNQISIFSEEEIKSSEREMKLIEIFNPSIFMEEKKEINERIYDFG